MNIQEIIKSAEIDLHSMQAILGAYFEAATDVDKEFKAEMKKRIVEENEFSAEAYRAVNDAIIFSTLATTLVDNEDFREAVINAYPIENKFLGKMRIDLFLEAVETIEEAIPPGELEAANQKSRIIMAKNAFSEQS